MVACTASNYTSNFNKMDQGKSKMSVHDLLPDKETLQKLMFKVEKYQKDLQKGLENRNYVLLDEVITYFEKLDMPWKVLEQTRVGRDINEIRKALNNDKPALSKRCRKLIKKWQPLRNIQSPTCEESSQRELTDNTCKKNTLLNDSDILLNRKRKLVEVNGKKINNSFITLSNGEPKPSPPIYEPKKRRFERSESVVSRSSSSSTVSSPSGNALNILASKRKNVQKTSALLTDIVVKDDVPKPDTPISMKSNSPGVFTDDDTDESNSRFSLNFINNSKKISPIVDSVNKSKNLIKKDKKGSTMLDSSQKKQKNGIVEEYKKVINDNKNNCQPVPSRTNKLPTDFSHLQVKKSHPIDNDFSWEKYCNVPSIEELQKKLQKNSIKDDVSSFKEGRVILIEKNRPLIAWPYLLNSRDIDFIA
ncbi:Transcription factor IIS, N-terminal domain-containing protein [Strongyloides ratti]|uniref:Transcription factor IIS, N-terminal domain-containing protein n=1 Tax=Strongyloides ratti TaxID=34506 RepID=A0A090LTV1_STRRB|nr:Transcription factor IIS, N-terminal domain-containing protein [Strongyloides ratti]CEF71647.1 Transcription factor IIS, N-terminal domain-containing protein [Strongyloides ratti]